MKCYKRIKFLYLFCVMLFSFKTIVLGASYSVDCSSWGETLNDFQYLFNLCKIIIPLLIVGLSVFDFIKAVAGKDAKDLKKAGTRLFKRLALAVIFFFLPLLLNFFLELMGANASVCVD